jgi:tripartite-type tricarboxylate transporter receptor subunit TctC
MREKLFVKIMCISFLVVIFIGSNSNSFGAENHAAFYKGKVIHFIVGFSPGGGYDTWSRLLASALEKQLNATVVVRNMPGAGGLIGLNYMSNRAKRDGTALMISPLGGAQLSQLLGSPGVKYDCRKFNWLIRLTWQPQVVMVSKKSSFQSVEDLKKENKVIATGPEPTSRAPLATVFAAEAIGLDNLKVVFGYPGSSEQIVAIMRGQAHFYSPSVGTSLRHLDELRPILVIANDRVSELPDVPAVGEYQLRPEGKKLFDKIMPLWEVGRSVITTPDVPSDRVKFLRETLLKCMQDEQLLAKTKRLNYSPKVLPGETVQSMVMDLMTMPADELKKIKYVVYEKYQ